MKTPKLDGFVFGVFPHGWQRKFVDEIKSEVDEAIRAAELNVLLAVREHCEEGVRRGWQQSYTDMVAHIDGMIEELKELKERT